MKSEEQFKSYKEDIKKEFSRTKDFIESVARGHEAGWKY